MKTGRVNYREMLFGENIGIVNTDSTKTETFKKTKLIDCQHWAGKKKDLDSSTSCDGVAMSGSCHSVVNVMKPGEAQLHIKSWQRRTLLRYSLAEKWW